MRVVPNLYPAFERQEVVIHSPEHIRSFAQLDDEQVGLVAEAWQERIGGAGDRVLAFVNEGRLAGASLPHSHSQLAWTALPAEHVDELPALVREHEVARRDGVVSAVHPVGAGPYECLIAPLDEAGSLADGLWLLRDLVRRLQELEGARAWNAWLHPGPRWHLHFLPRLTAHAGIELGAELFVNVVPPALAAQRLRG